MRTTTRAALTLAVIGAGLVTAAVHPAASTLGAAPVVAPPASVRAATGSGERLTPAAHPRVLPASSAEAVVARPTAPRRPATGPAAHPATAAASHRRVRRPAPRVPVARVAAAASFTTALMRAVTRIPTYHAGAARWVVSRAYAFWGTADWYHDVLYVSPDVPGDKLYDVAVHEWSHELSVLDYDGDVAAATRAMNAWFGGSGLTGAERAADCMAIEQGARWTHYTTCTDTRWRAGASRLVAGRRL